MKKKSFGKSIALLLAFLMLVSLVPLAAFADEAEPLEGAGNVGETEPAEDVDSPDEVEPPIVLEPPSLDVGLAGEADGDAIVESSGEPIVEPSEETTHYTVTWKVEGAQDVVNGELAGTDGFPAPPAGYEHYEWTTRDANGNELVFVWNAEDSAQPGYVGEHNWELTGVLPKEDGEPEAGTTEKWTLNFVGRKGEADEKSVSISVDVKVSEGKGEYTLTDAHLDEGAALLNAALEDDYWEVTGWNTAAGATITEDGYTIYADTSDVGGENVQRWTVSFAIPETGEIWKTEAVINGRPVNRPVNTPTPPLGMNAFLGWYSDAALLNEFNFDTPVSGNLTLYAKFSEEYVVSFLDAHGNVFETQFVEAGNTASLPGSTPDPIESGKVFQYWYLVSDENPDKDSYNFAAAVYSNYTLAPLFGSTHYVFFNANGGILAEGAEDFDTVEIGQPVQQPADPSRAGYTFAFWSEDKDADHADMDAAYNFEAEVDKTLYLYAIWAPATAKYSVVYWYEKANISVEAMEAGKDNKANYDTVYVDTSLAAVDTGSTATVTEAQAKGNAAAMALMPYSKYYKSDEVEVKGDGTTVVNVYFTRDIFYMTFDTSTVRSATIPIADMILKDGTNVGRNYTIEIKLGMDVSAVWPWKLEYVDTAFSFVNWSGYYGLQTSVVNADALSVGFGNPSNKTEGKIETSLAHYYTGKQAVRHSVTVVPVSTRSAWFETRLYYTELSAAELALYEAGEWDGADVREWTYKGETKYYQLTATGEVDKTQGSSPGTGTGDKIGAAVTSANAGARSWPGRSIEGFQTIQAKNMAGSTIYNTYNFQEIITTSARHYDLYYYMPRKSNTLTLITTNPDGEKGVIENPAAALSGGDGKYTATLAYGDDVGALLPEEVSLSAGSEYSFVGWYTDPGFTQGTEYTGGAMPETALVLYARYQLGSYTVSYYQTASSSVAEHEKTYGKYDTVGEDDYPAYVKDERYEGLGVFQGWGRYIKGVLSPYEHSAPVTGDLALYGLWKTNGFTVTYAAGEGSGAAPVDANTYKLGTHARVLGGGELTPPDGKVFVGWLVEGEGVIYYEGSTIEMSGDVTLVAKFAGDDELVDLVYHENYDDDKTRTVKVLPEYAVRVLGASASGFARTNYTLVAWADVGGDDNGTADNRIEFGSTINLGSDMQLVDGKYHLYAVWAKDETYTITFKVKEGQTDWGYINEAGLGELVYQEVPNGSVFNDTVKSWPKAQANEGYYFIGWTPAQSTKPMYVTESLEFVAVFGRIVDLTELKVANADGQDYTKVYGDDDPAFEVVWPDKYADIKDHFEVVSNSRAPGEDVIDGGYAITIEVAVKDEYADRYKVEGAVPTGTLTITKATLTPTITGVPASIEYGDALNLAGVAYTYEGYKLEDNAGNVAVTYAESPELSTAYVPFTSGVGGYTVNLSGGESQNYIVEPGSTAFEVVPKELNLEAHPLVVGSVEKFYSAQDPAFGFTDESVAALEAAYGEIQWSQLGYTFSRAGAGTQAGESAAGYTISATANQTTENYIIKGAPASGTLTINKLPITITPTNTGKIYGEDDPDPLTTASVAVSEEVAINNPLTDEYFTRDEADYTLWREAGEDVGKYDIYVDFEPDKNPNYAITPKQGIFTISPVGSPISIDMGDFTKVYGNADPGADEVLATISVGNLVGADSRAEDKIALLGITVTRRPGQDVGTYDYVISWDEDGVAKNYTGVSVTAGALEITQRTVHLTARSHTIYTGDSLPAFTAYLSNGTSLVKNDELGINDTKLAYSVSLAYSGAGTPSVGTYGINNSLAKPGTENYERYNKNYNIVTHSGTLTVLGLAPAEETGGGDDEDPTTPPIIPIVTPGTEIITPDPGIITPEPEPTQPEVVDDDEPPLADTVNDDELPLANMEMGQANWALLNLLIAVLTLVFAVLLFVTMFKRNKKRGETEEQQQARMTAEAARGEEPAETVRNKRSGMLWRLLSIIAGVLAPIVFLLTENIRNPMVFTDHWTLLMVTILVVQVIGMLLLRRARDTEQDEEDEIGQGA